MKEMLHEYNFFWRIKFGAQGALTRFYRIII